MQHLNSLNWVITSDDGRDAIVNKMGLSAPFDTFTGDYESKNAFANVASELAKGRQDISSMVIQRNTFSR